MPSAPIDFLEPRRLMSASQGSAVLADDRQVLLADRHAIVFDLQQIRNVSYADRLAAKAVTRSDRLLIHADEVQLASDRGRDPAEVSNDLNGLESDEGKLRADLISAKTDAASDRTPLIAKWLLDRQQWFADFGLYIADGG